MYVCSGEKTFVVIAENPKMLRVSMIIKENKYNVAKPDWLKRALGSKEPITTLLKFTPEDMLFATEDLKEQFNADADQYECDTPPMEFNVNEMLADTSITDEADTN